MNNVSSVILRRAGVGLHCSTWPQPLRTVCNAVNVSRNLSTSYLRRTSSPIFGPSHRACTTLNPLLPPQRRDFSGSATLRALRPGRTSSKSELGLSFRKQSLSHAELYEVFGSACPPSQDANRLLRILHGRRVDGTLDLPLPSDLEPTLTKYPDAVGHGLEWLRETYEIDEDAAIIARIEREESDIEQDSPSQLMARGQRLGLYAPQEATRKDEQTYYGPQSGRYRAQLSEKEGDVFGQSEFERIRAANEAKAAQEEEELEKQIAEITDREREARTQRREGEAQDTAVASRPEQGIEAADQEVRPPNEFEKWILRAKNRASTKLTLESPEVKDRSFVSRLLPSTAFVILLYCGLEFYKESWTPPRQSDRYMPNMDLSFATIAGIISINLGVFFLWRFPPAWRILNRYFLVVPATVKPLSLLGSVFSHSSSKHLGFNLLPLLVFGPSLHEELGRAEFLSLFLLSGVVGSYVSLVHNVSRNIMITSSLGASGAIWGVTAAFLNLHSNDNFTVFFIPEAWKETYYVKGWVFLIALIAVDVISFFRVKLPKINYFAHFGGAATGWLYAEGWKRNEIESRNVSEFKAKPTKAWWQHILDGSGAQQ